MKVVTGAFCTCGVEKGRSLAELEVSAIAHSCASVFEISPAILSKRQALLRSNFLRLVCVPAGVAAIPRQHLSSALLLKATQV